VVDVQGDHDRFQGAGGAVALVTMGTVAKTAAFRSRFGLTFTCFADSEHAAYRAYELPLGRTSQIAGPAVWAAGLRSFLRAGLGKPVGDVRQMPATLVIDSGGVIRFRHDAATSADNPSHEAIIQVLESLQISH
jgi:peroxiredoxin